MCFGRGSSPSLPSMLGCVCTVRLWHLQVRPRPLALHAHLLAPTPALPCSACLPSSLQLHSPLLLARAPTC